MAGRWCGRRENRLYQSGWTDFGIQRPAGRPQIDLRNHRRWKRLGDHQLLLEDGFSRYTNQTIVRAGDVLGYRPIMGGEAEEVQLLAAEDFIFPLTAQEQPNVVLSGVEFDYAPVVQGDDAGFAYVMLDENVIGKVRVVYGQTVEQVQQNQKKPFWRRWLGGTS